MDEMTARRRSRVRFAATALGLLVVGVAGYLGFVVFVRSDPDAALGVMVLAAGTGFAAFFSPCSFPLMLTFLTRRSGDSPGTAVASAVRVAAGAASLLVVVAATIALGGSALARFVEFDSPAGRVFRLGIGLLLIVFGLRQARIWDARMPWLDRVAGVSGRIFDPARVTNRWGSDFVYGFGYLLAGFG